MLMTALLSFASLQQPQMLISQPVSGDPVIEQTGKDLTVSSSWEMLSVAPLSPGIKACGKANYSRQSCGGTGRRQVLS